MKCKRYRAASRILSFAAMVAAGAVLATNAAAQPVADITPSGYIPITTNLGIGADTELRKADLNPADPPGGDFTLLGTNRGSSGEFATRKIHRSDNPTTDRGSLMFMKFDISPATLGSRDPALGVDAIFSLAYRQNNIAVNRVLGPNPSDPTGPQVQMKFDVFGLNPDFDHSAASWDYEWDEMGITYYNGEMPGVSPDSTDLQDLPAAPVIGRPENDIIDAGHPLNPNAGVDAMQKLGEFTFQDNVVDPTTVPTAGGQQLPVGSRILFQSPELNDLIQRAALAGQDSVTLMVMHGLDGFLAQAGEAAGTTPTDFLNFNYVWMPKEQGTVPGGTGPWAGASNANGEFSPALIVHAIPEPSTMALVGLGALAMVGFARRRR